MGALHVCTVDDLEATLQFGRVPVLLHVGGVAADRGHETRKKLCQQSAATSEGTHSSSPSLRAPDCVRERWQWIAFLAGRQPSCVRLHFAQGGALAVATNTTKVVKAHALHIGPLGIRY